MLYLEANKKLENDNSFIGDVEEGSAPSLITDRQATTLLCFCTECRDLCLSEVSVRVERASLPGSPNSTYVTV